MSTNDLDYRSRAYSVAVGATMGGFALGTISTFERVVFHSGIYSFPTDVALHLASALLVCGLCCPLLYVPIWLAIRAIPGKAPTRRQPVLIVGGILGALFGLVVYGLIFAPSKYSSLVAPAIGYAAAAFGFTALGAVGINVFQVSLLRWSRFIIVGIGLLTASALYVDLHRYQRSYGNAHLILGVCLLVSSGFLGARMTLAFRTITLRRVTVACFLLCAGCAAVLMLNRPNPSTRVAVLQFGGIEKSFIRHLLWPLTDRDGDGFSSRYWGADCDDTDPKIGPLGADPRSPHLGCSKLPVHQPSSEVDAHGVTGGSGTKKNLVWIVIDTLRNDVTEPHLQLFPDFAVFPQYRSCGSNTAAVLSQVFGRRGCQPRAPNGPIVSELNAAGFRSAAFLPFRTRELSMLPDDIADVFDAYSIKVEIRDNEPELLRKASDWLSQASGGQDNFFAYLHLVGGHRPYLGSGKSQWDRYVDACSKSLRAVARLVALLPPDTVVVIMGDHGEEFGEHGGEDHALTLYEEVLATPLLVRSPLFPAGAQNCVLGCPDLPTVAFQAALGAPLPPSFCEGNRRGRLALLDHPIFSPREATTTHARALALPNGMKVIWNMGIDLWELYDLRNDPKEQINLAAHRPDDLRRASEALLATMKTCPHGSEKKR